MSIQQEIWKDVPGYEGYYLVSNLGIVKSLNRTVAIRSGVYGERKGVILKQVNDKFGYPTVPLYGPRKKARFKIHRLVALAFLDNPENKRTVNHIDGVKDNNRLENLEWATNSENNLHAYKVGLRSSQQGENNPMFKTGVNTHGEFNKSCENCGEPFIAKIFRYRFCSLSCSSKHRIKNKQ